MGRDGGALGPRGLVSGPFLDVCTVWGPAIHSATCSDSGSLSTSISVSATMMKIKEGSGGKEKGSREKEGERERRERKISKQSRNSCCRKYRNHSTRID